jgi:hypothetical protein
MKHLVFLFFGLLMADFCLAQSNCSIENGIKKAAKTGTSIDTFYTNGAKDVWSNQKKAKIAAIQTTDLAKGISIKIFDFDTQKAVSTILLKPFHRNQNLVFLFANDYTFVNKQDNTTTVATENGKKRVLYDLKTNRKLREERYAIKNKEMHYTSVYFYENGSRMYEKTQVLSLENDFALFNLSNYFALSKYHNYSYSSMILDDLNVNLLANEENYDNLASEFRLDNSVKYKTIFYPNGKSYIDLEKEKVASKMKIAKIMLWDSLGKAMQTSDYFEQKTQMPSGVWLCFDVEGNLIKKMDCGTVKGAFRVYEYKKNTKNEMDLSRVVIGVHGDKPNVRFENRGLSVFGGKSDDFDVKPMEDYRYNFKKNGFEVSTPFFNIIYDEKGEIEEIRTDRFNYTSKSCPKQPPFIVEGNYKNKLPDGIFRIFRTDRAGKKTDLLVEANFKNGVGEGKCIVFCVNKTDQIVDTLYHLVLQNGLIVEDKYANKAKARLNENGRRVKNAKDEMKKQFEARIADANRQHNLYRKGKTNVWQQDTLLLYTYSSEGYFENKKEQVRDTFHITATQEDSTENTKIRVGILSESKKYSADFSFYKKTLDLSANLSVQMKAIIMEDIPYGSLVFDKKTNIYTKNLYFTKEIYRILNDSVAILQKYNRQNELIETVTDTIYMGCTLPQNFVKKLYFKTEIEQDLLDFLLLNPKTPLDKIDIDENIVQISLEKPFVKTTTVCKYDKGVKYACKSPKYDLQYNTDGSIDTNYRRTKDGKPIGFVKIVTNSDIQFANYDEQGRLQGSKVTQYLDHRDKVAVTKKERYEKGKLHDYQYFRHTDSTLLAEKTCKDTACRHYIESKFDMERSLAAAYIAEIKNDTIITLRGFYDRDTLLKYCEIKHRYGNKYHYESWHESGKTLVRKTFYDFKISRNDEVHLPKPDYLLSESIKENAKPYFEYHENGNIAAHHGATIHHNINTEAQHYDRFSLTNWLYEYDENGRILSENVYKSLSIRYPDFNTKEECIWEKLPIQEGKFANGYRVGKWQGFARTSEKPLLYEINYNDAGLFDGDAIVYDDFGKIKVKAFFKNGVIQGDETIYDRDEYTIYTHINGLPVRAKTYSIGGSLRRKMGFWGGIRIDTCYICDTTNVVIAEYDERGYEKIRITCTPNSFIPISKTILKPKEQGVSQVIYYYTNGKPQKIVDYTNSATTEFDEKGKTKIIINNTDFEMINDPKYAPKAWQAPHNIPLKPSKWGKMADIAGFEHIAKGLNINYHLLKNGFTDVDINETTLEYDYKPYQPGKPPRLIAYDLYLDKISISDQKGGVLNLNASKKTPIIATVGSITAAFTLNPTHFSSYNGNILTTCFAPYIAPKKGENDFFGRMTIKNPYRNIATIAFNPALVHRVLQPNNATFELDTRTITLEKKVPRYYALSDTLKYLEEKANQQEIQHFLKKTVLSTLNSTNTHFDSPKKGYEYEIGNTKMRFVLKYQELTNIVANSVYTTYERDFKPTFFPFHAPYDAFLNDGSLRVHAENGYFFLPFAPEKIFRLYNILIDQTEINGAFYIKKSDNMNAQLQAFAQQNGIEIKIMTDVDFQKASYHRTTDQELRDEYDICAFRYAR